MTRPTRLAVAALLVTVVATVVGVTRLTDTDPPPETLQAVPTVSLSATDSLSASGETGTSVLPETDETVQVEPAPTGEPAPALSADAGVLDVIDAAERGVLAWQSPDDPTRAQALLTLATAAYREAAATIDATRVPSAPPDRVSLRTEADGQALVDVHLEDSTQLAVILILDHDQWLVDDVRPVAEPQALAVP